jgi:hypothetical protein
MPHHNIENNDVFMNLFYLSMCDAALCIPMREPPEVRREGYDESRERNDDEMVLEVRRIPGDTGLHSRHIFVAHRLGCVEPSPSIFSQLLQLFPRNEFEQSVLDNRCEYQARGFTCCGQFVAMLFCQLGRAHTLP